jgi:hypothetical protein
VVSKMVILASEDLFNPSVLVLNARKCFGKVQE